MEEQLSIIPKLKKNKTPDSLLSLYTTSNYTPTQSDIDLMDTFCKSYYAAKKTTEATLMDQYSKHLHQEALEQFSFFNNKTLTLSQTKERIGNIITEYSYILNKRDSKSFAWTVFGDCLLHNILLNSPTTSYVPLSDPEGPISYLFTNFALQPFDHTSLLPPRLKKIKLSQCTIYKGRKLKLIKK